MSLVSLDGQLKELYKLREDGAEISACWELPSVVFYVNDDHAMEITKVALTIREAARFHSDLGRLLSGLGCELES